MPHTCSVPMPESLKDHALIHRPDALYNKYICGRDAEYIVGDWFMCGQHKKYMADPNEWAAEPIEESESDG